MVPKVKSGITEVERATDEANRNKSHELLKEIAEEFNERGQSNVTAVAISGDDTRNELLKAINDIKPDFAVCGTRGYGNGFKESISNHLVQNLEIPVLVIPWFICEPPEK